MLLTLHSVNNTTLCAVQVFVRLQQSLQEDSLFKFTWRGKTLLFTLTTILYHGNVIGMALFMKDEPIETKSDVLRELGLDWLNEAPGILLFGRVGDLGQFKYELYWLTVTGIHGTLAFTVMITLNIISIKRDSRAISEQARASGERANKILSYQLYTSLLTFALPLTGLFCTLHFGATGVETIDSIARFSLIFSFINTGIVNNGIHLVLVPNYRKIIYNKMRSVMGVKQSFNPHPNMINHSVSHGFSRTENEYTQH